MKDLNPAIAKLERAYNLAISAEESADTVEEAQRLAVKSGRRLNQLKLAKISKLPAVAKKVARRLERMMSTNTYTEVVEFISTHHYGGCACGCGIAVVGMFKQGHDMKLKSRMRSFKTVTVRMASPVTPVESPTWYVMSADAYRIPADPEAPMAIPEVVVTTDKTKTSKLYRKPLINKEITYNILMLATFIILIGYKTLTMSIPHH
jgi:hypothetical protein